VVSFLVSYLFGTYQYQEIRSRAENNTKLISAYMTKYLAMMMIVSSALLVKDGTPESLRKRQELWDYLKSNSKRVYRDITNKKFGRPLQLKSKVGRQVIILGYRFCNKIYGFN
jgi:hypothetical protein